MTPRQGDPAPVAAPAGEPVATDAVVIGAGPVGLFQVFQLGLLDIRAHVVDALPHVGGQLVELYPDKFIHDVPGLPACTGQALSDALQRQAGLFAPQFHLDQTVTALEVRPDGRFLLTTSKGLRLLTRTVFIAAGVGAFEPRRITVEGLNAFEGSQLLHHSHDLHSLTGQDVIVIGDTDAALETALQLSQDGPARARSVTLVHRRDSFRAAPERVRSLRDRCAQGALRFVAAQPVALDVHDHVLRRMQLSLPDGSTTWLPVDHVRVLLGLSPRLGPVTQWGLDMERKLLQVDTGTFSTSVHGIFAVGDINTYPGKRKLLVCGFHEATLAAYAAAPIVHPERPVVLQYTTSSTQLQALLDGSRTPGAH
ncbi:MAG: NAD(P)/FAD-dependent oxidoreductase [Hydrogenophaga sp.]